MTLYRMVLCSSQLQQHKEMLLGQASSLYAGADAVKDWFELQLDIWIEAPAARLQQNTPITVLFQS